MLELACTLAFITAYVVNTVQKVAMLCLLSNGA